MLTPVDQPLDKLDDLQKDEMYVGLLYSTLVSDRLHIFFSENMRGSFHTKLPNYILDLYWTRRLDRSFLK